MEAVAKHEFNATAADELSFKRNQVLKVGQASYVCPLCTICAMLFLDTEHGGWHELVQSRVRRQRRTDT